MRHLIIDVETVAIDDVATYLEPVSAPSNYKDEAKIAAYIAEETKRQTDKAALDIDLARIVAIGWREVGFHVAETWLCRDEVEEMTNLGKLWDTFWNVYIPGHTVAVTFNGLGYDLPLLLRRSLYLGVTAPKLQLDRFRHPDAIDLMQILCMDGRLKMHGLQFYANRFGLKVDQDITGADVGAAVAAGDWAAVERHCAADVQTTYLLAKRMGVL
jgi:hypothetical protein